MAKKNKKQDANAVAATGQVDDVVQSFMADAVQEVLTCTDGGALLHKHMAMGIEAVHAYVTLAFATLFVDKQESPETFGELGAPTIDYLTRACRLLGLTKVADAFSISIDAALDAFRQAPVELDHGTTKNAKALDILLK